MAHRGYRTADAVAVSFLLATPVLWLVAAVQGLAGGWSWSAAATIGVCVSASANLAMQPLLAWSARHGGMGRAASWLGMSPVLVAAAGPLAGDSLPSFAGWAGAAAVGVGVVVCNWGCGNAERPAAATAAAAAAMSCGAIAATAERATIVEVTPSLFAAVLCSMLAPALWGTARVLARVEGRERTPVREIAAHPAMLVAAASTVGVFTFGMAAVALGPAWVVLSLKRLAVPASTVAARLFDRRGGRSVEGGRSVAGSVVVAAGVAAVAAFS